MKKTRVIVLLMFFSWIGFTLDIHEEAQTKYPIVLIHGLYGYSGNVSIFGSYWGNIPDILQNNGAIVYIADVSQADAIEVRGTQLYQQLLDWGHDKYNLIGHSLGGLDARYVLENYPDVVASVSTISTPHRGSKVADVISKVVINHMVVKTTSLVVGNVVGYMIGAMSGSFHTQNFLKALDSVTTETLMRFNARYTVGMGKNDCDSGAHHYSGRRLYSWGSYGVTPVSYYDFVSKVFVITSYAFNDNEANDGLVSVCSMKFGEWLGAPLVGHHLTPVGGVIFPITNLHYEWALQMILAHAQRLKREGL
jgi:triacylglycerol lipase